MDKWDILHITWHQYPTNPSTHRWRILALLKINAPINFHEYCISVISWCWKYHRYSNARIGFCEKFVRIKYCGKWSIDNFRWHWWIGEQQAWAESFVLLPCICNDTEKKTKSAVKPFRECSIAKNNFVTRWKWIKLIDDDDDDDVQLR